MTTSKTELHPENEKKNKKQSNSIIDRIKNKLLNIKDSYQDYKQEKVDIDDKLDGKIKTDRALEGRMIFEKIYDNRSNQIKYLSIAVIGLSIYAVISVVGMYKLAYNAKVIPYIVKITGNNEIVGINEAQASDFDNLKSSFAIQYIHDFIKNSRSVYVDGVLDQNNMLNASAYTTGSATSVYQDYIEKVNPVALVQQNHESVDVVINNTIRNLNGSPNSTQVIWTEIKRNTETGEIVSTNRYTGVFTFKWGKKPSEKVVRDRNPLGFYITQISWSENN
jgi:type IV secretory pathway TrbF-like protein